LNFILGEGQWESGVLLAAGLAPRFNVSLEHFADGRIGDGCNCKARAHEARVWVQTPWHPLWPSANCSSERIVRQPANSQSAGQAPPLTGGSVAFGGEDHDHAFAFELWFALGLGDFGEVGFEFFHEVSAEVDVGHFTAAEHEVELDLVSLLEEFFGLVELGVLIVVVDADGLDAEFLELRDVSGVGFLFFFPLLVFPLAVIHEAADGRLFVGGDFDEIEAGVLGEADGLQGGDDADLFIGFIDESDGSDTNLFVATQTVLANGGSSCRE
jgi:hypothetical protein